MQANRFTMAATLAATLVVSASAGAQRSDRPIPIRKGEVATTTLPTDTVTMRDTMRTTDTLVTTRTDTVRQTVEIPAPPGPLGRFYWGIDAGGNIPQKHMDIPQNPGFTVGALLGWDSWRGPFGLRADGGYSRFGRDDNARCGTVTCPDNGNPELWHLNLDAKLRTPTSPSLYAVGGATWNRFRGITFLDDNDAAIIQGISNDWNSEWGWNAGGGLAFGFGRASLILEARYHSMKVGDATQSYIPIVLGLVF